MTNTIKPIETAYNGYRFRSRLEARWAVFFDTLGIRYEYEKEGYDLGELGWYLPDFWLPELDMFVEVKGQKPSSVDEEKIKGLAMQGTKVLLVGEIPHGGRILGFDFATQSHIPLQAIEVITGRRCSFWDASYYYYQTNPEESPWQTTLYAGYLPYGESGMEMSQGNIIFLQNKSSSRIGCYNAGISIVFPGHEDDDWKDYQLSPAIDRAFDVARQARFEHGQKGAAL